MKTSRNILSTGAGATFFVGGLFALLVFSTPSLQAASYDYYVKEGEDGDGSSGDPFGSLADAIEEAKEHDKKKIFVEKGTYSEAVTVSKGIEITGADTKSVILTGKIRLEDRTRLSEVTVETGGVTVAANADATLTKIKVSRALHTGITSEEGRGTITVKDSVVEKSRKGMYFQKGSDILIENVEVIENREEGIDIRANVSGSIKKSTFRNNGESGIEVILGSADLLITNNTFSGNGASGIATQFYGGIKKIGDVRIENNAISGSSNYGIDCKAPQGGLESKDYYLNSISASGNTFSKNKEGDIANRCRVLTDEERIELQKKTAVQFDQTLTPAEFAERVQRDAAARREYDDLREAEERVRVEQALGELATLVARTEEARKAVQERSRVECFLLGRNYSQVRTLERTALEMERAFEGLRGEMTKLAYDGNQRLVAEALALHEDTLEEIRKEIHQEECRTSLFGWLNQLIAEKISGQTLVTSEEIRNISWLPASPERRLLFVGGVGYLSQNRAQAIKSGDDVSFAQNKELLRSYDLVTADLASPIVDEADPAPIQNSASLLPLPARFANVLSAHNIRLLHLGNTSFLRSKSAEGYEKTRVNMQFAEVETFGGLGAEVAKTVLLSGVPVTFLEYTESKTASKESMIEAIKKAKTETGTVIVYVSYDRTLAPALTTERKELAREFAGAGATLVIGTGLTVPLEQETVGSSRIYYTLGSFWGSTLVKSEDRGLAVTLTLDAAGQPVFTEQVVSWDEEGKITFTPKE